MSNKKESPSNEMDLSGLVVPLDMETLFGMNQKIYKTMVACNDEWINFGRARLKEENLFGVGDGPAGGCKTIRKMTFFEVFLFGPEVTIHRHLKAAAGIWWGCNFPQ